LKNDRTIEPTRTILIKDLPNRCIHWNNAYPAGLIGLQGILEFRMGVADPYREQARECFRLARQAGDPWVKRALEDSAIDMLVKVEELEPKRLHAGKPI
jgi:hypothetical protein